MKQTKSWTHPITGETQEVEVGSNREKELQQKLHDAGFWEEDNPNKPEGCVTLDDAWLEKQRQWNHDTEARLKEYHERQAKQQ